MLIKRPDEAAKMFLEYIEEHGLDEQTRDHSYAYMFLANYYLTRMNYDQAFHYAQKCLNYAETKEEAKALLKTIVQERVHMEVDHTMWLSDKQSSKVLDYDREIPRQLQMLSITQKTDVHKIEVDDSEDDDDDDNDDDKERLCNRITMYMDPE